MDQTKQRPTTEGPDDRERAWQGNLPGDEGVGSQPPSTTSEPAYGSDHGQQQPAQGGEKPDEAGQVAGQAGTPLADDDRGLPFEDTDQADTRSRQHDSHPGARPVR
jgi:hypothetical protein